MASAYAPAQTGSTREARSAICADAQGAGQSVSVAPYVRRRPAETLAGFLAAVSIFVCLTGVAYRPLRLIPFGILLALIAIGIGGRSERLATVAVAVGAVSFAVGMAVAVVTSHPLW